MRCLLDKAAARRIMEALLKLASAQELTAEKIHQPMINNWRMQQAPIQKRLAAMRPHLRPSYRSAALPQVRRPEHIPEESLSGIQRLHEETASYEA